MPLPPKKVKCCRQECGKTHLPKEMKSRSGPDFPLRLAFYEIWTLNKYPNAGLFCKRCYSVVSDYARNAGYVKRQDGTYPEMSEFVRDPATGHPKRMDLLNNAVNNGQDEDDAIHDTNSDPNENNATDAPPVPTFEDADPTLNVEDVGAMPDCNDANVPSTSVSCQTLPTQVLASGSAKSANLFGVPFVPEENIPAMNGDLEMEVDGEMEVNLDVPVDMLEAVYSSSSSDADEPPVTDEPPRKKLRTKKHVADLVRIDGIKSLPRSQAGCCICKIRKSKDTIVRATIAFEVIDNAWKKFLIWIPPANRMCPSHHNGLVLDKDSCIKLKNDGSVRGFADLTREEIRDWVTRFARADSDKRIDVDKQPLGDGDYKLLFGVGKKAFETVFAAIKHGLKSSIHRSPRNALAMFLVKLRLGISQRLIGFLFGLPQTRVSKSIKRVALLLDKHFVDKYLGYAHKTRQGFIKDNDSKFARRLHQVGPDQLILVLDGTYLYTEKTGHHAGQRKLYSTQKGRSLVKVMVVVTTTGYIVDVAGLYCSNDNHNDAKILQDMFSKPVGIENLVKENDVFILDRGFRDVMGLLESKGIKTLLPSFLKRNQKQFTTREANDSRLVTMCRWVIEAVNGRLKNKFSFFDMVIPHQYFSKRSNERLYRYLRIACALMNFDCPPLNREDQDVELFLEEAETRMERPNTLMDEVLKNKSQFVTQRKCWIEQGGSELKDFPKLSFEEVTRICASKFAIKNAKGYTDERFEIDSRYTVQCHKVKKNLVRLKLHSKFRSSTNHYIWIEYNVNGNKINRYYCQCKGGARTIGCCSHVASVLWFLGYRRHLKPEYKPRTFGEDILEISRRKVVLEPEFGESDDEDIDEDEEEASYGEVEQNPEGSNAYVQGPENAANDTGDSGDGSSDDSDGWLDLHDWEQRAGNDMLDWDDSGKEDSEEVKGKDLDKDELGDKEWEDLGDEDEEELGDEDEEELGDDEGKEVGNEKLEELGDEEEEELGDEEEEELGDEEEEELGHEEEEKLGDDEGNEKVEELEEGNEKVEELEEGNEKVEELEDEEELGVEEEEELGDKDGDESEFERCVESEFEGEQVEDDDGEQVDEGEEERAEKEEGKQVEKEEGKQVEKADGEHEDKEDGRQEEEDNVTEEPAGRYPRRTRSRTDRYIHHLKR